jgi:hypothetical protein
MSFTDLPFSKVCQIQISLAKMGLSSPEKLCPFLAL